MPHAPAPNTDLAYADTLWKSADTLRGQVDARPSRHWKVGAAEPSGDSSQSLLIPGLATPEPSGDSSQSLLIPGL